jgi:hypothetical protein
MATGMRVYLETTIPSYLAARPSRNIIVAAHQRVTRAWWEDRRRHFNLLVSRFVLDEAALGDSLVVARRLGLLKGIAELTIDESVQTLAVALVRSRAVPEKAFADAAHIAVATVHHMDYLLTWNCTHIANAETVPVVQRVCRSHGHTCPVICTPEELMGGE